MKHVVIGILYKNHHLCVAKRLSDHNQGKGSRYVKAHLPAKLLATTRIGSKSDAAKLEYAVKQLSRVEKLKLLKSTPWQRASVT